MTMPNQSIQLMGASRFAHTQIERHRRVAPTADACRWGEQKVRVESGDGIFIPPGEEHKHRLVVLSDRVRIIVVEELQALDGPGKIR